MNKILTNRLIPVFFLFGTIAVSGKQTQHPHNVLAYADSLVLTFQYEPAKKYITAQLADTHALPTGIRANLFKLLSEVSMKFNDNESAMEYGLQALAEALKSNDRLIIAEAQVCIINAQQNMGQNLEIPEQIIKLYNVAKAQNASSLLRSVQSIEGYHMMQLQDFEKAQVHFSKALHISKKTLPSSYVIYDLLMLGISNLATVRIDSAFLHVEEATALATRSADSIMLAKSLMTKSFLYLVSGNFEASKRLALIAEKLAYTMNDSVVAAQSIKQQMVMEIIKNNTRQAIPLGLKALDIIRHHPYLIHKTELDSLLYVCYNHLGEHQKALFHFSRYNENMLSFYQKQKAYQFKQLEYLQELQSKEDALEKQKLMYLSERRKTSSLILLNILVISMAGGAIYFFAQRQRHRRNLFFKEQMISGLMKESELRTAIQNRMASIDSMEEENESEHEEDAPTELSELGLQKRKALFNQLLQLMEREKVYLNPTIDRNTLVGLLGTNRKYLYEAIKIVGNTSLSHILNRYRVFEAKKIIHDYCLAGNHQNLPDDIFSRAGFTAKTTYYRTFKKLTGITPLEYALEYSKTLQIMTKFPGENEEEDNIG